MIFNELIPIITAIFAGIVGFVLKQLSFKEKISDNIKSLLEQQLIRLYEPLVISMEFDNLHLDNITSVMKENISIVPPDIYKEYHVLKSLDDDINRKIFGKLILEHYNLTRYQLNYPYDKHLANRLRKMLLWNQFVSSAYIGLIISLSIMLALVICLAFIMFFSNDNKLIENANILFPISIVTMILISIIIIILDLQYKCNAKK